MFKAPDSINRIFKKTGIMTFPSILSGFYICIWWNKNVRLAPFSFLNTLSIVLLPMIIFPIIYITILIKCNLVHSPNAKQSHSHAFQRSLSTFGHQRTSLPDHFLVGWATMFHNEVSTRLMVSFWGWRTVEATLLSDCSLPLEQDPSSWILERL